MTALVIFLVFAAIVAVLWMGAHDVRDGTMTPGALVQFVIYSVIVAGAAARSRRLGRAAAGGRRHRTHGRAPRTPDPIRDPAEPSRCRARVQGRIAFEDVTFRYPARPRPPALDDIGLTIAPGETVALVGPSGAGKTTIFQLLLRFFDPDAGRDHPRRHRPPRRSTRTDLRRHIALVPQDPVIFATSARENIRFGRPEASDAEVEAAARAAAAHDFIARLPRATTPRSASAA